MRVTADDNSDSCSDWIEVKIMDAVKHVEIVSCQFDEFCCGQLRTWATAVDISPDRSQRCDPAEMIENRRVAYISGMENMVNVPQGCNSFRAEQAMRV